MTTPFSGLSANDTITTMLAQWGISSLAPVVQGFLTSGLNGDQAYLALTQTAEYKQRFAGNQIRAQQNLPVLSEAQYLSREDSLAQQFQQYGLPKGFIDNTDDYAKAIGNDIGAQEMDQRLSAYQAVLTNGQDNGVLAYAQQNYGLGPGDMLAYFMDPDKAAPVLTKLAAASQVGAAAAQTGFGSVNSATAERLVDQGTSQAQAQSGFSQAAGALGLTASTGDSQGLTKDDLEQAFLEQNAAAQQKVQQVTSERKAGFQGGGSFASGQKGVSGLGVADT